MRGEIGCRREQMVLGGLVPHPHQGESQRSGGAPRPEVEMHVTVHP